MNSTLRRAGSIAAAALLIVPAALLAHPFHGVPPVGGAGFLVGFLHPFTGLDHLMLATGAGGVGAYVGGRRGWLASAGLLAVAVVGLTLELHPLVLADPTALAGLVTSTSLLVGVGAAVGHRIRRSALAI